MPPVLLTVVSHSTGIAVSRMSIRTCQPPARRYATRYGRRIVSAPCRENALHAIARVVVDRCWSTGVVNTSSDCTPYMPSTGGQP